MLCFLIIVIVRILKIFLFSFSCYIFLLRNVYIVIDKVIGGIEVEKFVEKFIFKIDWINMYYKKCENMLL